MRTYNPNHPVVRAASGQGMKIMAIVMFKLGVKHVEIKDEDIDRFNASGACNIGIGDEKGFMEISIMSDDEAREAARKAGGLPEQS